MSKRVDCAEGGGGDCGERTLHVPSDMAVHSPDARIIGHESNHEMRKGGHRDGISPHGVLEIPLGVVAAENAIAPAYDLERVACLFFSWC